MAGKIESLADFDLSYSEGRSFVLGIDEAGRGSLAGPVSAGAVAVSSSAYANPKFLAQLEDLDDSKKLTRQRREELFKKIVELKALGYLDFEAAFASVEEIEENNILVATQIAMQRASDALNERMGLSLRRAGSPATLFGERALDVSRASVIIDGKPMKKFPYAHLAVVKGDSSSLAVAAASIVAKVSRDNFMSELSQKYFKFSFDEHKGYGTASHLQALMLYGPTDIHRPSFLKKLRAETIEEKQSELF